jgi:hypothetical protein
MCQACTREPSLLLSTRRVRAPRTTKGHLRARRANLILASRLEMVRRDVRQCADEHGRVIERGRALNIDAMLYEPRQRGAHTKGTGRDQPPLPL